MALSYSTAVIDVTAAATDTLVPAVAGATIRVHAFVICGSAAATNAIFQDTNGTSLSGTLITIASGNVTAPFSPQGYFEAGQGMRLDLAATTGNVTGFVRYSQSV